jgi:YgiT-type zinc finger domain-containing protein
MKAQGLTACPRCGGDLDSARQVERSVREGTDVALVNVVADVCSRCGETLLHPGMVELLAHAREVLRKGMAAPAVGRVFDLRNEAA